MRSALRRIGLLGGLFLLPGWSGAATRDECIRGYRFPAKPSTWIQEIDPKVEPFAEAYGRNVYGNRTYYGLDLSDFDESYVAADPGRVRLLPGQNLSGRSLKEYQDRLAISDAQIESARGQYWLSVGEGDSNFTAEAAKRGIHAYAVDVAIRNRHAPERQAMAYAQALPFRDQTFDQTVSVWLLQHFFRTTGGTSMFNPTAGRQAILEMIRVTRIGGEITINPIVHDSTPILDFLEVLKAKGHIDFEVLPRLEYQSQPLLPGAVRAIEGGQYFSVRIRRLD